MYFILSVDYSKKKLPPVHVLPLKLCETDLAYIQPLPVAAAANPHQM